MSKPIIVVFSGAGLSAESGIPTFRDTDGLWENHKIEDVADHEAWFKNPKLVLDFYKQRYEGFIKCKPHAGHVAIAKLQEKYDVFNITQNIDNLLEQVGCNNVKHLHGRIDWAKCEWHKDISNLDGDTRFTCDYKTPIEKPVEIGDKCPTCEGQLRPDIVWFREAVDMPFEWLKGLIKQLKVEGAFIVVGTSLQVAPASMLVPWFGQVKEKYFVDPKMEQAYVSQYKLLQGTAAEKLPDLVEQLLKD